MISIRSVAVFLTISVGLHSAWAGDSGRPPGVGDLSGEQANVLAAAQSYAAEYVRTLPQFICTQITLRETSITSTDIASGFQGSVPRTADGLPSSDVIQERLTFMNQRESYEVISINGRKVEGVKHMQVEGAISIGEFGSLLHAILAPASHAEFSWVKEATLRGHRVFIFGFKVPQKAGILVADRANGKQILTAYNGKLFVDEISGQVERITSQLELPSGFAIQEAERSVDYKPGRIAGQEYNLPSHSEVIMRDERHLYVNKIDYKNYRRFGSEARMLVDVPGEGTPPAESVPGAAGTSATANTEIAAAAPEAIRAVAGAAAPGPTPPVATSDVKPPAEMVAKAEEAGTALGATTASDAGEPTFRLQARVDRVVVPVVVRNAKGQAVGGLTKEDFQIFDRGKQQEILNFTVQGEDAAGTRTDVVGNARDAESVAQRRGGTAANFIVYLFDDVHLKFADLAGVREAAKRSMESLRATDQAAILTTSGQDAHDFTKDVAELREALLKVRPHPGSAAEGQECPIVSYYAADLMLNKFNPSDGENNPPLKAAAAEAMACMNLSPQVPNAQRMAADRAKRAATTALLVGEQETRNTLGIMRAEIRQLAKAPGKRMVILVSPGFVLGSGQEMDSADVIDEAIRGQVMINVLDARGLVAVAPGGDIAEKATSAAASIVKDGLNNEERTAVEGVLGEMAEGTGGTFVRNTNDLSGGLRGLAEPPDFVYLLEFKPAKLEMDGGFHPLKVKVAAGMKVELQARKGYFAPKEKKAG